MTEHPPSRHGTEEPSLGWFRWDQTDSERTIYVHGEVDLSNAGAITFVCVGNEEYTLQEAQDGGGTGAQNLAVIDRYVQGPPDATAAWTVQTQSAAATVDPDDGTNTCVIVHVSAEQLSDGFTHVQMNNTSSGTVMAIVHDLAVRRTPSELQTLTG